jgi:hypothetical protein
MNQEELELLTVEELKAKCGELGKKDYEELEKDALISILLAEPKQKKETKGKETKGKETKGKETKGKELVSLDALRTCKTETKGEVLGKFEISKEDLEKDSKIQRFIKIGFIVEA